MSAPRTLPDPRSGEAGFTLIEMLIATMLMVFILTALATVTAQWLPNWNHGMARMERDERFAFGLNRMVEDLAVAEFVPANTTVKTPYFDGSELSVSFVRTAIGPSSRPGLEIVRFQEVADASGPALVRSRAAFVPMDANCASAVRRSGGADPLALSRDVRLCRCRRHLAADLARRRRIAASASASPCATASRSKDSRCRRRRWCISTRPPNARARRTSTSA